MKNLLKAFLILVLTCLFNTNNGYAEAQTKITIQKSDWQKQKDNYRYRQSEQKSPKTEGKTPSIKPRSFFAISGGTFKIISYVLIFLLLGIILYFVLKYLSNLESNRKPEGLKDFKFYTDPDDLENQDLESLLNAELAQGNYNHALRIRFLMLLRELNRNKLIIWKRDKTNRYYRNQLRDQAIYPSFKTYCNMYEPTHYGNMALEAKGFQYTETLYNQMVQAIKLKES